MVDTKVDFSLIPFLFHTKQAFVGNIHAANKILIKLELLHPVAQVLKLLWQLAHHADSGLFSER